MQEGMTTCLGCRRTYYPGRTALMHRSCKPVWTVDTQPKMVDTHVVDTPPLVDTQSRHGRYKDYEARKKQMRSYMARRRQEKLEARNV